MKITVLGTRGLIEEKNNRHSKHTGFLIEFKDKKYLVDAGEPDFITPADFVILTHSHPDHLSCKIKDKPVFAASYSKRGERMFEGIRFLKDGSEHRIGDLTFLPLPVYHSIKCPAVGWFVRELGALFIPDFIEFVGSLSTSIRKRVRFVFFDGSAIEKDIIRHDKHGQFFGHASIKRIVRRIERLFPRLERKFVVHCGSEIVKGGIPVEKAVEQKFHVDILKDGDSISAERLSSDEYIHVDELLKYLADELLLSRGYYTLVGSTAVSGMGHDFDILRKGEHIETADFRFLRQLPPHVLERIQMLDDPRGPFTSAIPLYDLVLRRCPKKLEVMSEELVLSESAKKMAIITRREDRVVPFRFFAMQKTYAGYHKREVFSEKDAIEMTRPEFYPYFVDEKCDGWHAQIHKVGKRIEIYSEDGHKANLSQLKDLVERLKQLKDDFIACAEIEIWISKPEALKRGLCKENDKTVERKVHLGRADATGYAHSKTFDPVLSKGVVANLYDVIWFNGKDIHKQALTERDKTLIRLLGKEKFPRTEMVRRVDRTLCGNPRCIVQFAKKLFKRNPFAEGVMLKPAKHPYVLWYSGGYWIKWKRMYEITVKVVEVEQGKTKEGKPLNVWRAFCVLKDESGNPVPIGWTYHSKEKLKVGDIIEVRFQNLSKYIDPKTGKVYYNWWRPTVVGIRPEREEPDTTEIAERLVEASRGEIKERRPPADVRKIMAALGVQYQAREDIPPFWSFEDLVQHPGASKVLEEPPFPKEFEKQAEFARSLNAKKLKKMWEDGTLEKKVSQWFTVIQTHFRGKTVHLDKRTRIGDHLVGETWLNEVKDTIKEPITTLRQAKEYVKRLLADKTGTFSKVHPEMKPNEGVMIVRKELQPVEWLGYGAETIVEPGGVGATKEFPGVFFLVDCGLAIRTYSKPWFEEWYFYLKHFKGRLVYRLLPSRPQYERVGRGATFWRMHFADPSSPPYILSKTFFDDPDPVPTSSALPPNWEAAVPEEFRWWGKGLSKQERLKHIKRTVNFFIDKGLLAGRKFEELEALGEQCRFVLHRITWRGPVHVRASWISQWRLRFEKKTKDGILTFVFERDPVLKAEIGVAAIRQDTKNPPPDSKSLSDWFEFDGKLPANHPENPNKELEAECIEIDAGRATFIAFSTDFVSFKLAGRLLKGYFVLKRENPDINLWMFRRETKVVRHSGGKSNGGTEGV